ncbi:hypothetical protein ACJX0J_021598, partial [Zea mays]
KYILMQDSLAVFSLCSRITELWLMEVNFQHFYNKITDYALWQGDMTFGNLIATLHETGDGYKRNIPFVFPPSLKMTQIRLPLYNSFFFVLYFDRLRGTLCKRSVFKFLVAYHIIERKSVCDHNFPCLASFSIWCQFGSFLYLLDELIKIKDPGVLCNFCYVNVSKIVQGKNVSWQQPILLH